MATIDGDRYESITAGQEPCKGENQEFGEWVGMSPQYVSKFIKIHQVTTAMADRLANHFMEIKPEWDYFFFKHMPQRYRRGFVHKSLQLK